MVIEKLFDMKNISVLITGKHYRKINPKKRYTKMTKKRSAR